MDEWWPYIGALTWVGYTDASLSICLAKFLKAIITTERLSRDSFIMEALIIRSALLPQISLTPPWPPTEELNMEVSDY